MSHRSLLIARPVLALATGILAQSQTVQVQVAGATRNYILYRPTGLGASPPLVFVIHGFNMTAQSEVTLTKMNAVADREKFIVVYPNALPNASNQQSWDQTGQTDYPFLLGIIDTLAAKYQIDRKRVYASGFSQGGFMSFQLGCRYANVFAAIGPTSGLVRPPENCSPARPVPMIFTYGTNEGHDEYDISEARWVELNGCAGAPVVAKPYPAGNANSVVTRTTYTGCKQGAEVIVHVVTGGIHEWPMNTSTKINNSEEFWAFFKRFTLDAASEVAPPARAPGEKLRAGYAGGRVRVSGVAAGTRIRILDIRGKAVAAGTAGGTGFGPDGLKAGVYQVRADGEDGMASARLVVP